MSPRAIASTTEVGNRCRKMSQPCCWFCAIAAASFVLAPIGIASPAPGLKRVTMPSRRPMKICVVRLGMRLERARGPAACVCDSVFMMGPRGASCLDLSRGPHRLHARVATGADEVGDGADHRFLLRRRELAVDR